MPREKKGFGGCKIAKVSPYSTNLPKVLNVTLSMDKTRI